MISFKQYVNLKEATGNTQTLDQAKQQLMTVFQQEFQKDSQGALTWLNNLYTKILPGDYKNFYSQWQQKQKQPQVQQQQTQQLQQQQPQPAQQQQQQNKVG